MDYFIGLFLALFVAFFVLSIISGIVQEVRGKDLFEDIPPYFLGVMGLLGAVLTLLILILSCDRHNGGGRRNSCLTAAGMCHMRITSIGARMHGMTLQHGRREP